MATCANCAAENRSGARFCATCGAPLGLACPSCGSSVRDGQRFCDNCGTDLRARGAPPAEAPPPAPVAERRLVSVLFADLVGFTTVSEPRDAEDVRELLSRYFALCRRAIESYGGTVEKFIGDAVMAVWGAPVAQELDAELAVRAALELVADVQALAAEVEAPALSARAAVLTGEAAVTLGAVGEGMVAGDLVNTASRVQALAEPGTVFANSATRRAAEAAVVFEDAGTHPVKGKSEPVEVWRAVRVAAGRGGTLKREELEPPFVGREREFRLIKDLFHDSAERSRAHLVSVVGAAGSGKSRLGWEFFKYADGLSETIWWHRGRCLPYGEGVTYWALAEMVRMRAGISEGEDPQAAAAKLASVLDDVVPDPEERRWAAPRLAHLLGLEERGGREPQELFGAWRLFFERLAARHPVVLVFEDMQWADAGLLDFVEYLLDWSRSHPLFVITFARPDMHERRPGWGAGKRGFTAIYLEPLPDAAIDDVLRGVVPGLPDELRARIRARAEGIPLYAVETVRMLLDQGLLARRGDGYELLRPVDSLDVPETLHALIAARLDGLSPAERRALQDASVLGRTFTRDALAALGGVHPDELQAVLDGLVRKEIVQVQLDPRSPEHGQYGFLQDLVQRVAYATLSRRERRLRHLAAAAQLVTRSSEADELAEVLAAHLVAAYEVAPEDPDADAIRDEARMALVRGAERAERLAAAVEARRLYERAIALTTEPLERAALHERAGQAAWIQAAGGPAREHLERAMALFSDAGRQNAAARVAARLAEVDWVEGRLDEALERMERSYAVLAQERADADTAEVASQLGRLHHFHGDMDLGAARAQEALEMAEDLSLAPTLADALTTLGTIAVFRGLHEYGTALLGHAITLADEHELTRVAVRARNNLAEVLVRRDRYADAIERYREAITVARRAGSRFDEVALASDLAYVLVVVGRWEEALALAAQARSASTEATTQTALMPLMLALPDVHLARGEPGLAAAVVEELQANPGSSDVQERCMHQAAEAIVLRAAGRAREALDAAEDAVAHRESVGLASQGVKAGMVEALEAAWELGERERLEGLLGVVEGTRAGHVPRILRGHAARFEAKLAAADGRDPASALERAVAAFRDIGAPLQLAIALVEQGALRASAGRADAAAAAFDEAQAILEALGARAWLERLEKLRTLEASRVRAAG